MSTEPAKANPPSRNPRPPGVSTRTTLLLRIRNPDDNESWREFVALYRDFIAYHARRHGLRRDLAEDAVMVVLAEINQRIHDFEVQDRPRSFRSWLGQLTAWRSADLRRREPKFLPFPEGIDWDECLDRLAQGAPAFEVTDDLMEDAMRWACLERGLRRVQRRVQPHTYKAFDLLVRKETPVREAMRLTGMSRSSLYTAKSRVLASLKEEIALMADELR